MCVTISRRTKVTFGIMHCLQVMFCYQMALGEGDGDEGSWLQEVIVISDHRVSTEQKGHSLLDKWPKDM